MKKQILILVFLGLFLSNSNGQVTDKISTHPPTFKDLALKMGENFTFVKNFNFIVGAGTNSIHQSDFSNFVGDDLEPSFAVAGLGYKINSKFSVGIAYLNNIGNSKGSYIDKSGTKVYFEGDNINEQKDDIDDQKDDEKEDMDKEEDMNTMNEGNENETIPIVLTFNYKFSDKFPMFIQGAGGYSIGQNKPVYSAMLGYNQKIFRGLGIYAGIRYSSAGVKIPSDATNISSFDGIKFEIGSTCNF